MCVIIFLCTWMKSSATIICSESSHQILIHTACAINGSVSLGVKRERQTGIGGGVTTAKDKEQSLLVSAEGARGLKGALHNTGLPCFHDSIAEAAKHSDHPCL